MFTLQMNFGRSGRNKNQTDPMKKLFEEEIQESQSAEELMDCLTSLTNEKLQKSLVSHYKSQFQALIEGKGSGRRASKSFDTDKLPAFVQSIQKMNIYKDANDIGYSPIEEDSPAGEEDATTEKKVVSTADFPPKGAKGSIAEYQGAILLGDLKDFEDRLLEMSKEDPEFFAKLTEFCEPVTGTKINFIERFSAFVASCENVAASAPEVKDAEGKIVLTEEQESLIDMMKSSGSPQSAIDAFINALPKTADPDLVDEVVVKVEWAAALMLQAISFWFTKYKEPFTVEEVEAAKAAAKEEATTSRRRR